MKFFGFAALSFDSCTDALAVHASSSELGAPLANLGANSQDFRRYLAGSQPCQRTHAQHRREPGSHRSLLVQQQRTLHPFLRLSAHILPTFHRHPQTLATLLLTFTQIQQTSAQILLTFVKIRRILAQVTR